ncbi:HAD family phosphatase (plasmid) [Streptomyces sp. NBC_01591]|uniref:HAD family hydrolase n=1 Tax=Streptomyces sp. NBC_01591 TaxID=2975888 RepID=UPI002DD96BD7|nr:HAD family phosphatase [Streptomyces sp. NBC_01591]WSD74186.1 HAD family phosphatase [Streptomyces sp. NBC_01591]
MTQPQAPTDTPSDAAAYARGLLATVRPGACVFDFDGTLVDTSTINTDAARATLADLGLTVPEPWLRHAPLADLTALRHQLQTDHGLPLPCTDAEFVHRARAHWLARTILVKPVPRVTALARHLAAAVPTAVASANDGHVVRAGLNAAGLAGLFPVLVAREHVTHLKPHPDAYLLAATQLNQAPRRCLAFENTDEGVTAALAATMPVIDIRHKAWTVQNP